VHQVDLKDPGSQNLRTLAFKAEAVGVTQIYTTMAMAATARDRRKIMFFSHNKSKNVKISNNFFSFFSSLNQYFPHIPFVASKKETSIFWTVSTIAGCDLDQDLFKYNQSYFASN
jgi:hypothetical protein